MSQDFLPQDAPLDATQREWVNAFIAKSLAGNAGTSSPQEETPVTIIWGSQTGNSESLATKLAKALKGCKVEVFDMADYDQARLPNEKNLLLITSTYGDGEAPDNAQALHEYVLGDGAARMEGVNFAVFALGDTEYPDFCLCGKEFDARFEALGATRLLDRVDCDVEFDDEFIQWRNDLRAKFSSGVALETEEAPAEDEPYGKSNPYPSEIKVKHNLNKDGSQRETYHLEFDLEGSGLSYETGDALGVVPLNPESQVDELLENLPFRADDEVPLAGGKEGTLREALISTYDIRTLTKKMIVEWQAKSGSPYLRSLVEADDKDAYDNFIWGRELIDLVIDYPAGFADAEEFVSVLRKLAPRLYSISSSPKAHPGEVHLTVAIVRYNSFGRERGGVCSTFMSDRSEGVKPGVYVHANKAFRVPENGEVPAIMVGPGTGIAPFRAFLEERKATEAKGPNWLFFGNPYRDTDFLYEDELTQMMKDGNLDRLDLAFSRDQAEKIYVQDRMDEKGAELWEWLEKGAHFYVCGDATRMAKDVDKSLHSLIQKHGGKSEEEAVAYVKDLKAKKRYARDVY